MVGRSGSPDKQPLVRVSATPDLRGLLRWVYIARVCVSLAVFLAAAFRVTAVSPSQLLIISTAALASVIFSVASAWYTEIREEKAGSTFITTQSLFDLALVTAIVQVTDGVNSDFASIYILVIAAASVMLPAASSLLITLLAGVLYFSVIFWFNVTQISGAVFLQILVFLSVALVTSRIAARLRMVGQERKTLELEVRRLRLEASDIIRHLRTGIITVDANGSLVFANPAAERYLGFETANFLGNQFLDFVKQRSPGLADIIESCFGANRGVHRYETVIERSGGDFPIGVTTTLLGPEVMEIPTVTAIFADISERKKVEELRLRNERLEAVAELSASLAHEIKNPLASIRSSVEQISRSSTAGDDERFLGQLVVRESDRLSRLLSEFLDFSRVRVTERKPVNLRLLADNAAEAVRNHPDSVESEKITVTGGPLEIRGDEDLLHRVVFNLILNAVQASAGKASVQVEVAFIPAGELPEGVDLVGGAARVTVEDDGPGIPSDILERMFDPFVSGREGGSGLGLAIVQRAVDAHSGYMFVDSEAGVGTSLVIYLPVSEPDEVSD